jgi:hypothetical protein
MLILAMRLKADRLVDSDVEDVADWVLNGEASYREALPAHYLDSMPLAFSLQCGFWQPVASEIKAMAAGIGAEKLRTKVQVCALYVEPFSTG